MLLVVIEVVADGDSVAALGFDIDFSLVRVAQALV
jgi:hypothetical protein